MSSKFKIGMIQMKIGSNPKKNIDNAIKKLEKLVNLGQKLYASQNFFYILTFAKKKTTNTFLMQKRSQDQQARY